MSYTPSDIRKLWNQFYGTHPTATRQQFLDYATKIDDLLGSQFVPPVRWLPKDSYRMFYYVEPEVAGGVGANSIVDRSVHPPKVSKLHYRMEGWLGSDLLESFPCFIVSERLKNALQASGLTGFAFDEVEITKSEEFLELLGDVQLPDFHWLRVSGAAGVDDFGIAADHRLVVSERALEVLRTFTLERADVEDFHA